MTSGSAVPTLSEEGRGQQVTTMDLCKKGEWYRLGKASVQVKTFPLRAEKVNSPILEVRLGPNQVLFFASRADFVAWVNAGGINAKDFNTALRSCKAQGYEVSELTHEYKLQHNLYSPDELAEINKRSQTENNPTKTEKQERNMSNDNGFFAMAKNDVTEAGFRSGTRAISKGTVAIITSVLRGQGMKKSEIKGVLNFIATPLGHQIVSYSLGLAMSQIPMLKDNPMAMRLAKEFRVEALSQGMDQVVAKVSEQFMPLVAQVMTGLASGDMDQIRIATDKARIALDSDDDSEEEEEMETKKKRKHRKD